MIRNGAWRHVTPACPRCKDSPQVRRKDPSPEDRTGEDISTRETSAEGEAAWTRQVQYLIRTDELFVEEEPPDHPLPPMLGDSPRRMDGGNVMYIMYGGMSHARRAQGARVRKATLSRYRASETPTRKVVRMYPPR